MTSNRTTNSGLQNFKKQCEFKQFNRSHGKLTTVFDVLSLFYVLAKTAEDVKMLRVAALSCSYRTRTVLENSLVDLKVPITL